MRRGFLTAATASAVAAVFICDAQMSLLRSGSC
ncbi:twin-arginine translocation signal domain-containing protein [Brevundimonas bullata]